MNSEPSWGSGVDREHRCCRYLQQTNADRACEANGLRGGYEIGVRPRTRTQCKVRVQSDGEATAREGKRSRHIRAMTGLHILGIDDSSAVIDRRTEQEL